MERYEKLKLLRGLYCLTQEEIATLAGCHRSVYSTVEAAKGDSRRLTFDQALNLSESLRFDYGWFNDDFVAPIHGNRFAFIDLDWSQRHLAATTNVRCRRINDAERAVQSYLPQMLHENGLVKCSIGKTDNSDQLFFFLFDHQGLLLRTVPGQQITTIVERIQAEADPDPQLVSLTDSDIKKILQLSSGAVFRFLDQCNLDGESMALMEPEIDSLPEAHFNYENRFGDVVRETSLKAICRDILFHGFTLDEVTAMIGTLNRDDSKPKKSARP